MQQNSITQKTKGFTVVEILIVVPIVILVIGVFITAIVNMTGEVMASRGANTLIYNVHDALSRIEQDVKLSSGYLATNSFTLTAPQGTDDSTNTPFINSTSQSSSLILSTVATTNNPLSSSRNIVYKNAPYACSNAQVDQNEPVTLNVVYFLKNGSLWRRVIMPANYYSAGYGCDSITKAPTPIWQQATCSPSIPAGTFCKASDTKLVDGITNATGFKISYYASPDSTTADEIANNYNKTATDRQPSLLATTTVGITINATKTIAGREISQSGTIRATLPK